MKSDGAWRLILALLRSEDLRLRSISPRSGGGLHARQQPPGCGHGRVRGEHAAQVSVHHRRDVFVFRILFSCRCFQLLSDSRPHWHTTGKELRRPVQRHPISRGGAIAPSPPSPSANRVAVRHLPPRPSTPIGRPRRFFASSARPDVTCGAGVKSFQATEISVCGRGMGPEQSSMRQVDNFK